MLITATLQKSESDCSTLIIKINGRLDIFSYNDFTATYKNYLGTCNKIIIDMTELESLDSSGLGMLLMLREQAGGIHAKIELRNYSPNIAQILASVKFDKLFTT